MIDKISSWASGLIVAVIIGTIIEMLLPDNKNKKYVKVVIGLFIIYTITAPIIGELDNVNIDLNNILSEYSINNETEEVSASVDSTLEQTYKQNIETDIVTKLKDIGYSVSKISTEINFEDGENYGIINWVSLKLKPSSKSSIVNEIETVEISVGAQEQNSSNSENNAEVDEIKKYLNENYGIDLNSIFIQLV